MAAGRRDTSCHAYPSRTPQLGVFGLSLAALGFTFGAEPGYGQRHDAAAKKRAATKKPAQDGMLCEAVAGGAEHVAGRAAVHASYSEVDQRLEQFALADQEVAGRLGQPRP